MSAGESAFEVARRQREKAERLQRSVALWEQGAAGEVEVAKALEALPQGWVVLHDLAWPGRPKANLDHVVIGPGGVFVVDAKNWSGTVEVRDHVLRQNGRQRAQTVSSTAEAAIALQHLLPVSHPCVGVLCFVGDRALNGWVRDVMVCSTSNLAAMLTSRPVALDAAEVDACGQAVRTLADRRAAGVSTGRQASKTRSASGVRDQRASKRRLNIVKAVVALTFLAVLVSGGLTKITGWFGEQMVQQIVDTKPVAPTPTPDDAAVKKRGNTDAPNKNKQGR
jgi:hypothetical protein